MSDHPAPLFDISAIAEERIQEAMRRGDFDHLPGTGQPLTLDDDRLVPVELRAAYRILKNAGYVPPEVLARREIADLEAALPTLDQRARVRALQKLQLLRTHLGAARSRALQTNSAYTYKILDKLGKG